LRIDADQNLRSLRQAAMLSRATAGRRGMTVHLAPETAADVLVSGDLHGNLFNLQALLKLADLDMNPQRHLVLQEFVHGTARYPDGGCRSHRMLDVLAALKSRHPHRLHLIMGNHELAQWTGRKVAKDDVYFNDLFEEGVRSCYGPRAEEMIEAYDQLFSSMLLAVRLPNSVFICHSIPEGRHLASFDVGLFEQMGLREEDLENKASLYHLVWGRDTRAETARKFAEMVDAEILITGHIAQEAGYGLPSDAHLILDSMASPAAYASIPTSESIPPTSLKEFVRLLPHGTRI
jgi:hypothetical protein